MSLSFALKCKLKGAEIKGFRVEEGAEPPALCL